MSASAVPFIQHGKWAGVQPSVSSQVQVVQERSAQKGKASVCAAKLEELRTSIRRIEGKPLQLDEPALAIGASMCPEAYAEAGAGNQFEGQSGGQSLGARSQRHGGSAWQTGVAGFDDAIGRTGLEAGGLHEIRPDLTDPKVPWASSFAAALGFTLRLAALRKGRTPARDHPGTADSLSRDGPSSSFAPIPDHARKAGLICMCGTLPREIGLIHAKGLDGVGIASTGVLILTPKKREDALWVLEEAVRARALLFAIGLIGSVDLTPARRLALAAAETQTPCLLVTDPRRGVTAATSTRWRVRPVPGGRHPLNERLPGLRRWNVCLERARGVALAGRQVEFALEWCDATLCFRLAPELQDRSSRPQTERGQSAASAGHVKPRFAA